MLPTSTSSSSIASHPSNTSNHRASSPLPGGGTINFPQPPLVKYILLAEFDIDEGSKLTHQYPRETGTDEHLLAEHMLPDGAHDRTDDWTVFYLNQIPPLTVKSKGKGKEVEGGEEEGEVDGEGGLLYVMSLVRTKKVATVRRGALVKALAVATPFPYIQIYKPLLLLALESYFTTPTLATLSSLYNSINSMDLTTMPLLSNAEKLVLRPSERVDLFGEKFVGGGPSLRNKSSLGNIGGSRAGSALGRRTTSQGSAGGRPKFNGNGAEGEEETTAQLFLDSTSHRSTTSSGSLSSLTSREHTTHTGPNTGTRNSSVEDFGSYRGHGGDGRSRASTMNSTATSATAATSKGRNSGAGVGMQQKGTGMGTKDTHWFETKVNYMDVGLPIRIPLGTFGDEVGEYSLIKLLQTFSPSSSSSSAPVVSGPHHPHLHTSGPSTHPIILLFNALITHKRVIFLGHGLAAGSVAELVLAACALGSGCGTVLGGFKERCFPYTNLSNLDNLENVPGFIAGVCNPAFLNRPTWWDVLCNIETGKIIVSKDIAQPAPSPAPKTPRSGVGLTLLGERGPEDEETSTGGQRPTEKEKSESPDAAFMEEITSAINSHYGESVIRARFTDYVLRFVRLASRYEEEVLGLSCSIGFPTSNFSAQSSTLGSGYVGDENVGRELTMNGGRVEGWRSTPSYFMYQQTFMDHRQRSPVGDFDLSHQLSRLRQGRRLPPAEIELITRTLALHARTDEGIVAILAHLPPHFGGLLPISFGLFHPSDVVRQNTVEFLDLVNFHPTGSKFISTLNAFHRTAYVRLSEARRVYKANHYARQGGQLKDSSGAQSYNGSSISVVG